MSTIKLPPLPPPPKHRGHAMFAGSQMIAYAEQAVNQALEHAAAIAERQHFGGGRDDDLSWTDCAALIAVKIRALIPENSDG